MGSVLIRLLPAMALAAGCSPAPVCLELDRVAVSAGASTKGEMEGKVTAFFKTTRCAAVGDDQ